MTQMKGLIRQRGAIGIIAPGLLLLAILFAALAVDTGRLMMTQRHLQTVADMAALDASGNAGYCGTGDSDISLIQTAANESAVRNGHTGTPLFVEVGELETIQGIRHFSPSAPDGGTAVRVVASKTVPASIFAGGIWNGEVTLQAEAVAERNAVAAFSAGSGLARVIDEGDVTAENKKTAGLNMLLGGLLNSNVPLDLVSYSGVANTDLSLLDLVKAQADVGTVDELLNADISVTELLTIAADALGNKRINADSDEIVNIDTALSEISLINAAVRPLTLKLADVLNITTSDIESAAKADINVLNLITTSAMVANGTNFIDIPLKLDVLGLVEAELQLNVIELPQIAIGPPGKNLDDEWRTQAQTAQVELSLDVNVGRNIALLSLVGVKANIGLGLNLAVAKGEAWLESLTCNNDESEVIIGARPTIAQLELTPDTGVNVTALQGSIAEVGLGLSLNIGQASPYSEAILVDRLDSGSLPKYINHHSNLASLGELLPNSQLDLNIKILGLSLLDLLGLNHALKIVLIPLLSEILQPLGSLLDGILSALGIELGVIDVELTAVEIDRPELKR